VNYVNLGRTGLRVSEVCLGTMTFGWTADKETSFAIMDVAVEAGCNFFDTADIYARWATHAGASEEFIGQWFRRTGKRHDVVLATKVRGPMGDGPNDEGLSRAHIVQAVEASLRRLETDYIDLYQAHWFDENTPMEETLAAFDDLIHQGKVRYIGCSNHPAWMLCKALWISDSLGVSRYESLQPHYNLVHRAEFERELMPLCQDQQLGVIPYSPLAGGFLSGKYRRGEPPPPDSRGQQSPRIQTYFTEQNFDLLDRLSEIAADHHKTTAQVALAWVLENPVVTSIIIGANSVEQLRENLGVIGLRLTAQEKKTLDNLTAWEDG